MMTARQYVLRMAAAVALIGLALVAAPTSAWAAITVVGDSPPREGDSLTIRVTDDGVALAATPVVATYGPGSQLAREVEVGTTDAAGQLSFVPDAFGLLAVTVGDESTTLSVRAAGVPPLAVVVFALASSLLVTLVVVGFRGAAATSGGATSGEGRSTT